MASAAMTPSPHASESNSEFGEISSSSLQYINAQLLSHGFTKGKGISLDGLSNADSDKVVKCLLSMLGQRVEDLSRTEDLSTRLRTLSYEYERLSSMHQSAKEKVASSEREANLHKSKLASCTKSLQIAEDANRHTTAELQRSRTAIQGVRAAHQTEIKKKEKEIERMVERWTKLADSQSKLTTVSAGIRCANLVVSAGSAIDGRSRSLLDAALDDAESSRSQLADENLYLRKLVVSAYNEAQDVLYRLNSLSIHQGPEPIPFTLTDLFPTAPAGASKEKMMAIFNSIRGSIRLLSEANTHLEPGLTAHKSSANASIDATEITKLQVVIRTLRRDLETARKAVPSASNRGSSEESISASTTKDDNNGQIPSKSLKEEMRRTQLSQRELEEDNRKMLEEATHLEQEATKIEVKRLKPDDEMRAWRSQQVETVSDDPPLSSQRTAKHTSLQTGLSQPPRQKSPRKSPQKAKITVGKVGFSKKTRTSRSISGPLGPSLPNQTDLAYETELIQVSSTDADPSNVLSQSFLPTAFSLPPPSPESSLPPKQGFLVSPPNTHKDTPASEAENPFLDESGPAGKDIPSTSAPPPAVPPKTPTHRSFPVAKPFARGMTHAYSPARPSPLSRILMLGNSPGSPVELMDALAEEDEEVDDDDDDLVTADLRLPLVSSGAPGPALGELPKPSLKGKGAAPRAGLVHQRTAPVFSVQGTRLAPTVDKEKANASSSRTTAITGSRSKEKEKTINIGRNVTSSAPRSPKAKAAVLAMAKAKAMQGKLPVNRGGGARRVPVDSEEAAPMGRK